MIKQVLIPLAAFALTVSGVSAFDGELLKKLDLNLSDEQVSALEEAHELRLDGADRNEVHAVLEDAGIDWETMHEVQDAMHEYRDEMRDKVHAALENEDYGAFLKAVEGSPIGDIIDTREEFERFLEAFDLRKSGDYEGAREIIKELGLERPMGQGYRHGMGHGGQFSDGQFRNSDRDGDGDGYGHRGGERKGFGGRDGSN